MKLGNFTVSRAEFDDKAAKAKARRAKPENKLYIDGSYYLISEVAKVLGVSANVAGKRVSKLIRASGPITFQRLRDLGQ